MKRTLLLARGLGALLVLGLLLAGVPWLLVTTVGNPYPTEGLALSGRLTDSALLGLVAVLAWLTWAQLVVCVVVEAIAEARVLAGRSAAWLTRIPGTFDGQQQLARWLVQAVVAAVVGTGAGVTPATPAVAAPASEPLSVPVARETPNQDQRTPTAVAQTPVLKQEPPREITVVKGDTLWGLAERHLGAGERWKEIADLNAGLVMPDGERFTQASDIRPGWTLRVPAEGVVPAGATAGTVTVEPGDSLWSIATDELGDGEGWPRLYAANRSQITDPDVIHPGQELHLPGQRVRVVAEDPEAPESEPPQSHPGPVRALESAPPAVDAVPDSADADGDTSREPSPAAYDLEEEDRAQDSATGRMLALLTGGGALLGAGLFGLLAVRRRIQYRYRRSGRVVAQTPPDLVPVEAAVQAADEGQDDAEFLDEALRELVDLLRERDGASTLPHVAAVCLTDDEAELHLVGPCGAPAPSPWRDDQTGRVLTRSREIPVEESGSAAPYPTLVTIGIDDTGARWLLDLEAAGIVQVGGGEDDQAADLARFMVAELAVNPWADGVRMSVGDLAPELRDLAPDRISTTDLPVADLLVQAANDVVDSTHVLGQDVLTGRADGRSAEAWLPTVAITRAHAVEDDLQRVAQAIHWPPGRKAVAAVVVGGEGNTGQASLELTLHGDGWMSVEPLGIKVRANLLPSDAAAQLAALIGHHREAEDEPMPAPVGHRPYEQVSDAAGSLVLDDLAARDQEDAGDSLLPLPDESYVETAATTPEDLAALAPRVPEQRAEEIAALDPALDDDLAEWHDPETLRPRIGVLGPVELLVAEEPTGDARRRRGYAAEIVVYLATHPQGVTTEQLACAFDVQENVVHNYVAVARKWVGIDPETGVSYIPDSTRTEAARKRGMAVYQVHGVLSDEDLFRRLRVRAQARGHDGMEDLVAALSLVRGRPFDQIRRRGYGWLADTPLDHQLTAAIVDVAHVVATDALARGDYETAQWAAQTAIMAAPAEEKPRLDLAAALNATGQSDRADEMLERDVFMRVDEGTVPIGPSDRMRQIVRDLADDHPGTG